MFYAQVVYESDDLVGAERLLNVYLPLARDVGLPDHVISSYRMRSTIAFYQGNVDTALQAVTELEYIGHERQLPRVSASAKLERARLLGQQGHSSAAREELGRVLEVAITGNDHPHHRPAQEYEDLVIGRARLEIQFGQVTAQVQVLETEISSALRSERRQRALRLKLLLALAFYRAGDIGRAVAESTPLLQEAKGISADERKTIRQQHTQPMLDALHDWMPLQRQKVPEGSPTAKALDYSLRRWVALISAMYWSACRCSRPAGSTSSCRTAGHHRAEISIRGEAQIPIPGVRG